MNCWFVKSPFKNRGWGDAVLQNRFTLFGIRNHQAKNNIAKMQIGDIAIYYSSAKNKSAFGLMEVVSKPYNDPSSNDDKWLSIDFKPIKTFNAPATLEQLKDIFDEESFIDQPRLSVSQIINYEKIYVIA